MRATWFAIPDAFLVEPRVFGNERLLFESFCKIVDYYMLNRAGCIASHDPSIATAWPTKGESGLSAKEARTEAIV